MKPGAVVLPREPYLLLSVPSFLSCTVTTHGLISPGPNEQMLKDDIVIDLRTVPDETKWKFSAQCAARLPSLYEQIFRPLVGEAYDEHEQEVWIKLADLAFEIARTLQLPIRNAREIAESLRIVNAILFGPDFKEEVIEVGEDGAVLVTRRCPFLLQGRGLGSSTEGAFHRCMAFTLTAQNRFNPKYASRYVRTMCMGDRQCEFKIGPKPEEKKTAPQ